MATLFHSVKESDKVKLKNCLKLFQPSFKNSRRQHGTIHKDTISVPISNIHFTRLLLILQLS